MQQFFFYMADKIIVSNEYTKEILINSHNLKNVYKGKMVVGPSPRNSVFYNELIRKVVHSKHLKDLSCLFPYFLMEFHAKLYNTFALFFY